VADGEYSCRIAQAGGKENAFTSRDYTVYFAQLSADKLPLLLELEADRMANLLIDESSFRRELEVVKEERRMRTDDQPVGLLQEALHANAFVANPVRYPVIGWMDDLQHARADDLRKWYRQWYAPNNATLVIVGDVDPAQVIEQANHYFGKLPAKPARAQSAAGTTAAGYQAGRDECAIAAQLSDHGLACAGTQRPADEQAYAYALLEAVLSGDSAARLPRHMVSGKALARCRSRLRHDGAWRGPVYYYRQPAMSRQPAELEAAIRQQLQDIVEHGVSEQELARARLQLDADEIYQRDSLFAQAMRSARWSHWVFLA
jgi:zinc protease